MIINTYDVNLPYLKNPAKYALRNDGHQIIAIQKEGIAVTRLQTLITTGSINETYENNGVSHFLEHLLFKGSKNYRPSEIDRILEGEGAIINAGTSKDYTQYHITLPTQGFSAALKLHFDMLFNATLPDEEIGKGIRPEEKKDKNLDISAHVTRERAVVIEEIKMGLDNPLSVGQKKLSELIYKGHPYERTIIGTPEIIGSINRDEIFDYYKKWYSPPNMITVIASDLDTQYTINKVDKALTFAHENRYADSKPLTPPAHHTKNNKSYRETIYKYTTNDFLFYGTTTPKAQDIKSAISFDIASMCLGDGGSSRMTRRLIENLSDTPFIDIMTGSLSGRDNSGFMCLALIHPNKLSFAEELFRREIEKLTSIEPITEDEFNRAIIRLKTSFAADSETVERISNEVAYSFAIAGNLEYYLNYLKELETISLETVNKIISTYLHVENFSVVIITDEDGEKTNA